MLVLVGLHWLEFADHVLQEKQRAVIHARQSRTEATTEAKFIVFLLNFIGLLLPVHAEGRIGEQIVERLAGELIVREGPRSGCSHPCRCGPPV